MTDHTYWTAPGTYTMGEPQPTKAAALREALDRHAATVAKHVEHYGEAEYAKYPLPELITVDLRGVTLTKGGGSRDEVIERFNWTTIEAATAALHELERLIND